MKADWRPQKYRLIPKWGAAPFAAVFSPLGAPSGKCTIGPSGFQPPKRGQMPSAGAVYWKMALLRAAGLALCYGESNNLTRLLTHNYTRTFVFN